MALTSMTPSVISGISCSNNRRTRCGRVRLSTIRTFEPCLRTSKTVARTRSFV